MRIVGTVAGQRREDNAVGDFDLPNAHGLEEFTRAGHCGRCVYSTSGGCRVMDRLSYCDNRREKSWGGELTIERSSYLYSIHTYRQNNGFAEWICQWRIPLSAQRRYLGASLGTEHLGPLDF